jgi:3-hydroxyacyl-[acyl-carrier-protein] dehydratase
MLHSACDEISPQHPAIPGHFPGNPIVPGVLLLVRVLDAVTRAFGSGVGAVTAAKFHAPLRPGEHFKIELERVDERVIKFRVLRGETLIAGGTLRLNSSKPA